MEPRKFQTETQWGTWDQNQNNGSVGPSVAGWALPSDPSQYIGKNDPWTTTLANRRTPTGIRGIRLQHRRHLQPRYLQFSDGTPLPKDGTVLQYHNTEAKQNFIRNTDGSLTRQDFNETPSAQGHSARPATGRSATSTPRSTLPATRLPR